MDTKTQSVIPQLIVDGASEAIDFYVRAFGARELYRLPEPDGKVAHAELEIAGSVIMLADEYPDLKCIGPRRLGGTPCALTVYVDDVDSVVARAVAAGATAERPIEDEFYGDRVGWLRDPFGHRWAIHTRREQLSSDEIKARYAQLMAKPRAESR
jgi:PhnB protein